MSCATTRRGTAIVSWVTDAGVADCELPLMGMANVTMNNLRMVTIRLP